MPKPTGPSNPMLRSTIADLRSKGYKEKINFLLAIADKLEKPTRAKVEVSLSKLERLCAPKESIVVPGKILSSGALNKPLNIYACSFSKEAKSKIEKSGGKVFSINELLEKNPKGTNIRIIC